MENVLAPLESIKSLKLEENTFKYLESKFKPFLEQVDEWKQKAQTLVVTDVSQKEEMKLAKESRLAIRSLRINADKIRKELKEDSLRYGRAVQGIYNVIEDSLKPIEEYLEEQEKFEERLNERIKNDLRLVREERAKPYREYMPQNFDLAILTDDGFEMMIDSAKLLYDKKEAEKAELERERLKALKEEQERKELERLELEKAKKEAERLKAILEAEKKKEQEAKREAERLQAILDEKNKKEEEERKIAMLELKKKVQEERKLKNAPDKKKLLLFAHKLENLEIPELASFEANDIIDEAVARIKDIVILVRKQSENL